MGVRVGGHPAFRAEVGEAGNFQRQFALPWLDLNLLPHRLVLEPLGHFQVHFSGRKLHLKRAIHVGKGSVHQFDVGAVILEPLIVDFRAVSVRRDVAALFRPKSQAHRSGPLAFGIEHAAVNPAAALLNNLDASASLGRFQFAARQRLWRARRNTAFLSWNR